MENDKYTILGIEEKSRTEFQIAYAVESNDIPRFKELVTVPTGKPKEEILAMVNDTAYTRLKDRREKRESQQKEREEQERIERMRDTLKAEIENMKGPGIPLKKPRQKKKQLQAPEGDGDKVKAEADIDAQKGIIEQAATGCI